MWAAAIALLILGSSLSGGLPVSAIGHAGNTDIRIAASLDANVVDGMSAAILAGPDGNSTSWAQVQIAFVLELSPYDGAFDVSEANESGADVCGSGSNATVCFSSLGVNFLIDHAQQIADSIQAEHSSTPVSFDLVAGFATRDQFDSAGGLQYIVGSSQFTEVADFGLDALQFRGELGDCGNGTSSETNVSSCKSIPDYNSLDSDAITELYGVLSGVGLNWSPKAHHVVVLLTSSAPRAPGYVEDYGAIDSPCGNESSSSLVSPACQSTTCEPSYAYGSGNVSPECEGWITSQDGEPNDSIAMLAQTSRSCVNSLGGECTIDVVDFWNGPTDPTALFWWPNAEPDGGGVTAQQVIRNDVDAVLLAGCDMAAATGGSWDGPAWFECPDGQNGTIQYVSPSNSPGPNSSDPTLLDALTQFSFGTVEESSGLSVEVLANQTEGPAPLHVGFSVVIKNGSGPYAVNWTFGDGGSGSGSEANHTYLTAGTYEAVATVANATSNASGRLAIQATGIPPLPLTLVLSAEPLQGAAPLEVNLSSVPSGGTPDYALTLCFESGAAPSECTGSPLVLLNLTGPVDEDHVYSSPGLYTIVGSLSDSTGTRVVETTTVNVTAPTSPIATASVDPTSGKAPLPVTFQITVEQVTAPYTVQWYFGDGDQGSSISGQSFIHVYSLPGTFDPQVVVTDASNHSTSVMLSPVHVGPATAPPVGGALGRLWNVVTLPASIALEALAAVAAVVSTVILLRRREWRKTGTALVSAMERSP